MLQAMKDKALSTGAKISINQYIKEYGEIVKLNLNSQFKSMVLEVKLDGENENLRVEIENYKITEDDCLKISGVTTSRTWINRLASQHLESKEFKVPAEYAQVLRTIV
ncbi:hypothetical protein GJV85_12210 [Sulfurimonas aquatica]|uniref:Uncharacterized protein n=1 Tax=Sulfurimonas aquatica TaxID=2672570 RepID=A0A975B285_9BACT|nr:hypothetical protein [Sulfurimonas aquatica]QSZ42839.1 hypothetical protein GJV85_12210 [Sulfurimonas aquatica]